MLFPPPSHHHPVTPEGGSLYEHQRRQIHDEADRALTRMTDAEAAMERRLEMKGFQVQEMIKTQASSTAELERAKEEITVLRRNLEDLRASKPAAVQEILDLAQKRQEDALLAQENRHIEAMRVSQEAYTASIGVLSAKSAEQVRELVAVFTNTLEGFSKEVAGSLQQIGAGIQASIASSDQNKEAHRS
jgi:hypothetical protein